MNDRLSPYLNKDITNNDVLNNVIDLFHYFNNNTPSMLDITESFNRQYLSLLKPKLNMIMKNAISLGTNKNTNHKRASIIKIIENDEELTEETHFQTKKNQEIE